MTLRWKLMLALIGASLLGVLVSFAVMTVVPDWRFAGLVAALLAAGLAALSAMASPTPRPGR